MNTPNRGLPAVNAARLRRRTAAGGHVLKVLTGAPLLAGALTLTLFWAASAGAESPVRAPEVCGPGNLPCRFEHPALMMLDPDRRQIVEGMRATTAHEVERSQASQRQLTCDPGVEGAAVPDPLGMQKER